MTSWTAGSSQCTSVNYITMLWGSTVTQARSHACDSLKGWRKWPDVNNQVGWVFPYRLRARGSDSCACNPWPGPQLAHCLRAARGVWAFSSWVIIWSAETWELVLNIIKQYMLYVSCIDVLCCAGLLQWNYSDCVKGSIESHIEKTHFHLHWPNLTYSLIHNVHVCTHMHCPMVTMIYNVHTRTCTVP